MSVPHQETWDLYKATIERFLNEGYAPFGMTAGTKGSSVQAAERHLAEIGQLTGSTHTLGKWIAIQQARAAAGKDHRLPDWSLWSHEQARQGKLGYKPVLPGFEVSKTSATLDETGNVTKTYVTQKHIRSEVFAPDPDHVIKGVSALVDADGKVIQRWVKTADAGSRVSAAAAIKEAFDEYKGRAILCQQPDHSDSDLLTAYVIGDHHLGLYCWKDETGRDYDLDIGEELLRSTMSDLVATAPSSGTAIILSLGDFFHTDNSDNQTTKGTPVDCDSRRAKVYKVGVRLMISCIEMALQKHNRVIVRCLPGNHDQETTPTLAISLWAFFHNEPRVDVDCSPSRFFHHQHGSTMVSATHGDKCKIFNMPGVMAATQPTVWGATRFRYALSGHIHHKEKFCKEEHGVICETFQVLPPPDAWHVGMGFGAGRSMTAINYHRERGEVSRNICSVSPLS